MKINFGSQSAPTFYEGEVLGTDREQYVLELPAPHNETHIWLNPLTRRAKAERAKWAFVIAILLFVFAAPFWIAQGLSVKQVKEHRILQMQEYDKQQRLLARSRPPGQTAAPRTKKTAEEAFPRSAYRELRIWDLSVYFALSVGTCALVLICCRLFQGAFSPWRGAAEFGRDLLYTSLIFALVNGLALFLLKDTLHIVEAQPNKHTSSAGLWYLLNKGWIEYICLVGALAWLHWARGDRRLAAWPASRWLSLLFVPLLPILINAHLAQSQSSLSTVYWLLSEEKLWLGMALGIGGLLPLGLLVSVVVKAIQTERQIIRLQQMSLDEFERGGTGARTAGGPMELTVTVIGNAKSGKTTLIAGAHREWNKRDTGDLVITSATGLDDPDRSDPAVLADRERQLKGFAPLGESAEQEFEELLDIENRLYGGREFPLQSVRMSELPFDVDLRQGKRRRVCLRLHCHDYPGGLLDMNENYESLGEHARRFKDRMGYTDALLLLVDMSHLRRNIEMHSQDVLQSIHVAAMNALARQNEHNRVIPIALVLTKCDEIYLPDRGNTVDEDWAQRLLKQGFYKELESKWRTLMARCGGRVEYRVFATTSITNSEPDPQGLEEPFLMKEHAAIYPTGCASPLLWVAARCLYWNATLLSDIKGWVFGLSSGAAAPLQAAQQLENLANDWELKRRQLGQRPSMPPPQSTYRRP